MSKEEESTEGTYSEEDEKTRENTQLDMVAT
jgi:hypothetical protein